MQQRFDKRGFTGTVFADDAQIVTGVNGKIKCLCDGSAVVAENQVFTGNECHGVYAPYCKAADKTERFSFMMER